MTDSIPEKPTLNEKMKSKGSQPKPLAPTTIDVSTPSPSTMKSSKKRKQVYARKKSNSVDNPPHLDGKMKSKLTEPEPPAPTATNISIISPSTIEALKKKKQLKGTS